ncbi:MAG: hypothetical protein EB075_00605 [Bacteroidetes bacterium]|nr:hypothetical protein [Bacteroidota bacterium]
MDPNLHQKQGINHMNRVLAYAPMVAEGTSATVHLTAEDWQVVADTLFRMETPKEILPEAIKAYALVDGNQAIELSTEGLTIKIEMI